MSEEMSMLGRARVAGDSSHPQHQEIPVAHCPQMWTDELLKVIKEANGMPVLFVPSSDGRLVAVALDRLQNLMPASREGSISDEMKEQNFRSWLLLLTSLVATVTFTAGLTPPGGFWSTDDDKDKKYRAGDPVMLNKSTYSPFYTSNTMAFFTSLMIIASLAKNRNSKKIMTIPFTCLVATCFICLGSSYISGTWISGSNPMLQLLPPVVVLGLNIVYMTAHRITEMWSSIIRKLRGSP
uniref:PGG domain-containing protein n=1 Tax=Hordeum vulgare subsp. vulgare TaxID=112509 RepID=A0A8I6YX47_HORVV